LIRTAQVTLAGASLLAVAGCGRHAPSQPAAITASTTAVASVERAAPVTQPSPTPTVAKAPRAAKLPGVAQAGAIAQNETEFVGPFPHRTNPFALPNADHAASVAKVRANEKRSDERLLGFVDVDGRKALLQIDGQVWAARAGESRDGIEVVEIAPAHVTLRRQGATWNVSLMTQGRSG
jgi:hypothetical protein